MKKRIWNRWIALLTAFVMVVTTFFSYGSIEVAGEVISAEGIKIDVNKGNLITSGGSSSINEYRSGAGFENGDFWFIQGVGGWVKFKISVPEPGTYQVYIGTKDNPDRGICLLTADAGKTTIGTVDVYNDNPNGVFTEHEVGTYTFQNITEIDFTLKVTGNHPNAAKTGIALDYFRLAKKDGGGQETTPEPEKENPVYYTTKSPEYRENGTGWTDGEGLCDYDGESSVRVTSVKGDSAIWDFYPPQLTKGEANYMLSVWVPENLEGAGTVTFTVNATGGKWTREADQKTAGGSWVKLAVIKAQADTSVNVLLTAPEGICTAAAALKVEKTTSTMDAPDKEQGGEDTTNVNLYINQSGYDTEDSKRATITNVEDGTQFQVKAKTDDSVVYTGTTENWIADFSDFRPEEKSDYYLECKGKKSYDFTIAKNWMQHVSVKPALDFMEQSRSDAWEYGKKGIGWRDGHQFSFELPSLVLQYMANPSYYDQMERNVYRISETEYENLRTQNEPDIIWLMKFGAERYYDWHVNEGRALHGLIKEQLAYFLYLYPEIRAYVTEEDYERIRDMTIEVWEDSTAPAAEKDMWWNIQGEKHNLLEVQDVVGEIKGGYPPAHSIVPNLMMYEIVRRDGLGDGEKYFQAAYDNCVYVLEHFNITDTRYSKGQRMSEHVVMENLAYFQEMYPDRAPGNLKSEIARWASVMTARSNNQWDMRMAASVAAGDSSDYWTGAKWAYDQGQWTSIMNECGNEAGLQSAMYAAGRVLGGMEEEMLQTIGDAAIDNMFGRNPSGRMFFYDAIRDIEGADLGWYKKYAGGNGVLGDVAGRIDGSPKEASYPYNPDADPGYTEGWIAYNSAWNASLAYEAADKILVSTDVSKVEAGNPIQITMTSAANLDYSQVETAEVVVTNTMTGESEKVTVTENAEDGSYFTGTYIVPDTTCKLEISYGYGIFKKTAEVLVTGDSFTPVTDLVLEKENLTLKAGSSENLQIKEVIPADATFKQVDFRSEDCSVATVTSDGLVKGVKEGSTVILVSSRSNPEVEVSCRVEVEAAVPVSLAVKINPGTIGLGKTAQVEVTGVKYSDGSMVSAEALAFTYESKDTKIASVDDRGVVAGSRAGRAVIEVITEKDGVRITGQAVVTVEALKVTYEMDTLTSMASEASASNVEVITDKTGATGNTTVKFTPEGETAEDRIGQWVEFSGISLDAGIYKLDLRTKFYSNSYGTYQISIDGKNVGEPINFLSQNVGYRSTVFEDIPIESSGGHTIRFTVTGTSAADGRANCVLDTLTFSQVGEGEEEPEPILEPIHKMDEMYKCTYKDTGIQNDPLSYRLYVPADYDKEKLYPLLVYLNGAGSRGTDNEKQLVNLAPLINPLIDNPDYPCIIAVPQLPGDKKWVNTDWGLGSYDQSKTGESNALKLLMGMIGDLQKKYSVDENRLYLMGQSFGGYGTWDAVTRYPDTFAAAIPMCGAGDPSRAELIKDMPLMVLHGDSDPTVPVTGSRDMVAALQAAGSSVTYLEYEGDDHYIQRRLFEQPDIWMQWLFAQKKGTENTAPDFSEIFRTSKEYTFNFNSSPLPSSWSFTGTNKIEGSQLVMTSPSGGAALGTLNTTSDKTDGMISAFITINSGFTGGGGLVFRYQDANNYAHVRFVEGGLELLEMIDGKAASKLVSDYKWTPGRIACLKVVLKGNRVTVTVDNDPVFNTVLKNQKLCKNGAAGLRYYNGTMKVDDFIFAEPGGNGWISPQDFDDRQVIQRNAGTKDQKVTFTGSVRVPKMKKLELSVVKYDDFDEKILDWTEVNVNTEEGTYEAAFTLPQGGWYRTLLRAVDENDVPLVEENSENRWGIGMNILCIGQSNMVGIGLQKPYVEADDLVSNFMNETWTHLEDPYDKGDTSVAGDGSYGGSMVPAIGNKLVEMYHIPVGFIPAAKGGVSLMAEYNGWLKRNESNPADRSNLYGNSLYRAKAAGGIEFIIMNQGENDVSRSTPEDVYRQGLETLIGYYHQDLGYEVPLIYCQLGPAMAAGKWDSTRDPFMTGIRSAQKDADNGVTLLMGASEMDLERNPDNLHYTTASQSIIGQRIANAICYSLGDCAYYQGPEITDAVFGNQEQTTIQVRVKHYGGDDITPAEEITGFEVFEDGEKAEITSAVRKDRETIELTLRKAVDGTVTMRYLYGCLPDVQGMVKDNSELRLPLCPTNGEIKVKAWTAPDPVKLPFEDVDVEDWYYQDVCKAYEKGWMTGMSETIFAPSRSLNRAQFATILYRMAGKPEISGENGFADVEEGEFYTDAVIWAKSIGVMRGYDDEHFGPADSITREQMATVIYRYAQYQKKDVSADGDLEKFPDGDQVSPFAAEAMRWCTGTGLIQGNGLDKTLAPQEEVPRAVCAVVILRYAENLK